MLIHYLKIAFRNIWKYKTQSFIGILGLAFGLACFVPALYWLQYETSYDNFYPDSDRIYRIYSFDKQTGETNELVSGILERKLHEQLPATQTSTVFFTEHIDCRTEETPHVRLRTVFSDSTFFGVFPQTVICGNAWQPLEVTNNLVLTETTAIRLFGSAEKAIGKTIRSTGFLKDDPAYIITAVVKDPPANTNVPFDALLSHEQLKLQKNFISESVSAIWTFATLQMYVKIPPHSDINDFTTQLRDYPSLLETNSNTELRIMPIGDIRYHLSADVPFTLNFIRLFFISGILLLFCALFNFLNLHLGLFRQRMREFRLRAVNGASSAQLIRQMLFELACAIFLALLPAYGFVFISCSSFSELLNITMNILLLTRLFIICSMGILLLITGIGFSLFFRLSRLATTPGKEKKVTGKPVLQRITVASQLAISIILIIATLVVMMQMHFVNHKDLGFDRNGIIYLSGMQLFINNEARATLNKKLASIPQIEEVSDTYFTPQHTIDPSQMMTVEWPDKQSSEKPVSFCTIRADSKFDETFRVSMLQGEWINEGGEHQVVINEEAVRIMDIKNPVGTVLRMNTFNGVKEYRIAGVMKDCHLFSFRSRILPTAFIHSTIPTNNLYIRAVQGQEQEAVQRINEILPEVEASFADVHPIPLSKIYDSLNQSEQIGLKMFSILAVICLLISLFGIYAVATAATLRRRKEIAIRKISGAESGTIVRMFFHEYILQVIIAGALALPLSYIAMNKWLQGYAYRINIPLWLLLGVVTGVILLVLLTVLGQVLRASSSNPAEVIKSEN